MRLISKERAYALASQWASYMDSDDPGQCLYALYTYDGRPLTEAHRLDCLKWLRSRPVKGLSRHDYDDLQKLIRFMANTPLRPSGAGARQ